MFKPNLHAAHAACEEGDFTYDGTTEETKGQRSPQYRRHPSRHSEQRQQDVSLWATGRRQHQLDVDQEV
jgi:hypothetical protein